MFDDARKKARNQPEIPSYIFKSSAERGEFLSQLGHFDEEQKMMFNRLCDMWDPDIPYSKFLAKVDSEFSHAEPTLRQLMLGLEKGKSGAITLSVEDGKLVMDRISLAEHDSLRFWYWIVENSWQRCLASSLKEYPTLDGTHQYDALPRGILQPLALVEVTQSFIKNSINDLVVYVLPDLDGRKIVVTPPSIYLLIDLSRMKIRNDLAEGVIRSNLANLMGGVEREFDQQLTRNEHDFWQELTNFIILNQEDLMAKRSDLDVELYIAAKILNAVSLNEIKETERQREKELKKTKAIHAVLGKMANNSKLLLNRGEFDDQFVPYEKSWPDIRDFFLARFTQPDRKTGSPMIAVVDGNYLLMDNMYPLLKSLHGAAIKELRTFYTDKLHQILRSKSHEKCTPFTDIEAFRESILNRLRNTHPVLVELLSKPELVSRGIIHYSTEVLKTLDEKRIGRIHARYFENGVAQFKSFEVLFHLSPRRMFDEAFYRLRTMKRLAMRWSGRYNRYRESMSRLSRGEILIKPSVKKSDAPVNRPANSTSGGEKRQNLPSRRTRLHSIRQRENAWDRFKNAHTLKTGTK